MDLSNLLQKTNIRRTVVEFRANLKENLDKANAGFPVVVTWNDVIKCVVISPEQAEKLFSLDDVPGPFVADDAIDPTPIVEEEKFYEVSDPDMDAITKAVEADVSQGNPVVPEPPTADIVGDQSAISDTQLDSRPIPEAPVEATTTVESPEPNPEPVAEESVSPQPAPTVECEVTKAAPAVVCMRPAVRYVRFDGIEMNICAYHLQQLLEREASFEVLSETPVVSG